jgi:four helix bundle protein
MNTKARMSNTIKNPKLKYDLEERTAQFGQAVITFARTLNSDEVNRSLVSQVVRSSTSVGANYMEADGAESKKDFQHKIALCKKEANETHHWLRMIAQANPPRRDACRKLWREANELTLIFSAILHSTRRTASSLRH